ncbi:MAG: glycosyltransferase [Paludisphaera borealis]|uniref:glycosyltransferase n=1 Tax=Paludisphaera borealis TaxID=1387353 RepID=UPI00283BF592|nr:glycosyltransferase [Paludisphaera borealis]MDR3620003.1 glycosyltransferase [Paludisphaera borealis]
MTSSVEPRPTPKIAVAIPCYNEAAAVGAVVDQFRAALPDAEIVVFDNNSNDGTGAIASARGVRVVVVPKQGKGHAVRAAFETLRGFDVVMMVDGDGTYPAEAAPLLAAPILEGVAATTVGARQPVPGAGAMAPVRALGNVLIRTAFRVFIGPGAGDLLSGYRAFSREFVESVDLRSEGFEIETELTVATVARGFPAIEVSVPYRPRIAGTESKLRAFRDGRRILSKIVAEGIRLKPWRAVAAYGVLAAVVCGPLVASPSTRAIGLGLVAAGLVGLAVAKARVG